MWEDSERCLPQFPKVQDDAFTSFVLQQSDIQEYPVH